MGSGAILVEVVKAARQLAEAGIATEVFSVTSWSELARDGQACEAAMLAEGDPPLPFVTQQLGRSSAPIVAATDYVRAVPESIRAFLPPGRSFLTLGTDGFGRSDTRAALRELFGVDAASVVRAARRLLAKQGTSSASKAPKNAKWCFSEPPNAPPFDAALAGAGVHDLVPTVRIGGGDFEVGADDGQPNDG